MPPYPQPGAGFKLLSSSTFLTAPSPMERHLHYPGPFALLSQHDQITVGVYVPEGARLFFSSMALH